MSVFNDFIDSYQHFLLSMIIIILIALLLGIIEMRFPRFERFIRMFSLVAYSVLFVEVAGLLGPFVFSNGLNYTVSDSRTITSSDATYYTLTAFLAIAILYMTEDLKKKEK